MTGADSPVIADSSTVAIPSTMSPSPGITSPAVTTHRSPSCSADDGVSTIVPSAVRTRAVVSARVLRSVAACALPRPSAMASAKLANSTVNHNHSDTSPANAFSCAVLLAKSRKKIAVVITEPTSTMNITGLRYIVRGFSLRMASTEADPMIARSKIDFDADSFVRTLGGRRVSGCGRVGDDGCGHAVLTVRDVRVRGPVRALGRTSDRRR